ncbi:hypothetical protein [Natrinema salinisoli]|uniref:hypothetical protein n=1 Tax=Natrinema salinisoli TaxID=2878535 RepID=UPI001CF0636D|nr:hypothetical protein [Natrinema salinisoli]
MTTAARYVGMDQKTPSPGDARRSVVRTQWYDPADRWSERADTISLIRVPRR